MALGAPPPRRSRRERLRLPSIRLVGIGLGILAVVVTLVVWAPWQGPGRREWSAAPQIPRLLQRPERAWLTSLGSWVGFVRNAADDPTDTAVADCKRRLAAIGPPPNQLVAVHDLAADTCGAATAQAHDRRGSELSWDTARAGRANDEEREANHDLALLLRSLRLSTPPGGRVDATFSRIASKLSGRAVSARCFTSESDWRAVSDAPGRTEPANVTLLGFAVPWEDRIDLAPSICRALDELRRGSRPNFETAFAIEVLTHESEHLVGPDGIENEAKTDCYAAQRMWRTGAMLGVPAPEAHRLAKEYFVLGRPQLLPTYRSPECRDGGTLDLAPGDGRFP